MDQRNELHFLCSHNSFNHVGVVVIVVQVRQMLVGSDEGVVTKLGLKIDSQCFDSVAHRIRCLHAWQVLQEFWVNSHVGWFFMQLVVLG
jgi:hypothetical protein